MMRRHPRPVRVACSRAEGPEAAVAEIVRDLGPEPCCAVLFFSSTRYSLADVATCMAEAFPDVVTVGCTTTGEIGPNGLTRGEITAIAFDATWALAALPIDLASFRFEDGGRIVAELLTRVRGEPAGLSPERHVFLTLTDGLAGKEELLVASLGMHAPGTPLVGGSAGDDLKFERTWVALNGHAFSDGAVVLLLEPGVPFDAVHLHHFRPTERRVVVTSAEPGRRLVRELDGWPAPRVLAELMGIGLEALLADPEAALARYEPVFAFGIGETFFLRTVMAVVDGALLMGGAVEEGAVLRHMASGDLVADTRMGVRRAVRAAGREAVGLLLFNCGGRMREARARGVEAELHEAMCPPNVPTCGFVTYGEQFGPMQVNSTLTGLVFYHPAALWLHASEGRSRHEDGASREAPKAKAERP